MFVPRVWSRISRSVCRGSPLLSIPQRSQHLLILFNQFHSPSHQPRNKLIPVQVNLLHSPTNSSSTTRFFFSSSPSPASDEKEHGNTVSNVYPGKTSGEVPESSEQNKAADGTKESDLESEDDLSRDDLVKLVAEKEALLKLKNREMEKMQDKVLRTYAEMENVMARTRREAENSKKFAIQSFAKSLLDVSDNLGRASSVVKESFSKIDASEDSTGAVALLKTLLEGVQMTEKQLEEVFKKFGVEKYDPTNEPFDPHRHNAVFQVPDGSKPPGSVAVVLKAGYMLYDRVIRPAEVGVIQAVDDDNNNNNNNAT